MRVSRRRFLQSSAIIPFATWVRQASGAGTVYTRYEARSQQGKAMLKLYQTAVANMNDPKKTPVTNPGSWQFQWYTHFIPGPQSLSPKAGVIANIYKTDPTYKALANDMWDTCQSHMGQNENFFLPWHRMFVYFFERIVRKASGDQSFALPYWNYSVQGSTHGVIPPEFTQAGSSLYRANRNPGVNTGQPIDKDDPGTLDLDALKETRYDPALPIQGFCLNLDANLHGNVHGEVGNSQNMGYVPTAGGDPIFWMHHCNIDRLWASWNKNGGQNLNDPNFLKQPFVFADENGQRVSAVVKDFLDIAPLNYQYDNLEPKPPLFTPLTITQLTSAPRVAAVPASNAAQLALTGNPVSVALEAPAASPAASFSARVASLSNKRLFLVMRNLETNVAPGTLYRVYLNMPENTPPDKRAPYYAGTINFFGAMSHEHPDSGKFASFDITDAAKRLKANTVKPVVTIIPVGTQAADSKPIIGQVSLLAR